MAESTADAGAGSAATPRLPSRRFAAALVATGILLSRLLGLVRESLKARYLGATSGIAADAFNAAVRIPNFLQNLFGEGVLSASFIPVYANLLARGDEEEAGRVAGAVFGLLSLATSIIVLLGVLFTPALLLVIAPGFSGERRELTILITRILFPGTGVLVLGAWCLGVLNSHRRFFLSYVAPVISNLAMIVALVLARDNPSLNRIAIELAWAYVIGAVIQFFVQLPVVLRLAKPLRVSLDRHRETVRTVIRNFGPVFVSRGVVQISAYIDQVIASWLPLGVVSLLFYGQTISLLPVSLFGMSIAAAELPEMSSAIGSAEETAEHLRTRLNTGLKQIAFFVIPSAVAFLLLGDVIAAAVFQSGRFTPVDTRYIWGIIGGSAVGLLATTMGRLYSSAYYAQHDTRTPLRFAIIRIALTTVLGLLFAFPLPAALGIDRRWGAAGLTASAGIAGWVEFMLLRSRMNRRIGRTGAPARYVFALWVAGLLAGAAAFGVKVIMGGGPSHRFTVAVAVLGTFGVLYMMFALLFGASDMRGLMRRVVRR
jgi:putative peptidoglycan lipid II flippase